MLHCNRYNPDFRRRAITFLIQNKNEDGATFNKKANGYLTGETIGYISFNLINGGILV